MKEYGLFFGLLFTSIIGMTQSDFVKVNGTHFEINGEPYYFLGTNFWYGMNLGARGKSGDRERLIRELDQIKLLGMSNLRIVAGSEGPDDEPWRMVPALQSAPGIYNEEVWEGLDFLLNEMGKRNLYAVVCLNNFWPWSGGMAQYVAWENGQTIPYPPPAEGGNWATYQLFTSRFYQSEKAKTQFEKHILKVLHRKNVFSGKVYKDDPTIMAWELANEPRGILKKRSYRNWINRTTRFIKSHDANHLVTIGSEGMTPSRLAGNRFIKDHKSKDIDYSTLHIWVQNWGWYDPDKSEESLPKAKAKAEKYLNDHLRMAEKLEKPLVLEEFGISRDKDDHSAVATVSVRDDYYRYIFEKGLKLSQAATSFAGINFWAWGGEGRPSKPRSVWKPGDDFIGDPPHEYQGWYSVYDQDSSTHSIIREYARKFNHLNPTQSK